MLEAEQALPQGPFLPTGLQSMPSGAHLRSTELGERRRRTLRRLLCAVLEAISFSVGILPEMAWGEGILDAISGDVESQYNHFSSKLRDSSGNTTKTEVNNFINTGYLNLNYDLLPTLNLNTGVTYESNISNPTGDNAGPNTEVTRLRPFVWLTLRDTTYNTALGYALQEQTLKTSGLAGVTLNQETFNANTNWRPSGLPSLQLLFTKTDTYDDNRSLQNLEQNNLFVKPEYIYGGLDVYYAGNYVGTNDKLRDVDSTLWSHEGRLIYSRNFLDNRISLTTDDRLRFTQIDTTTAGQGQVSTPVIPVAGLSGLNDTPLNAALPPNPALIDGNLTASAGVNIGLPPLGGNTQQRNLGLDFLVPIQVNSLQVWVDRDLPQDIANSFSWEIYTSTDNLNWTFVTTVPVALFGPFLTRFEINFPTVQSRYVKVVTRPLRAAVPNAASFPDIFITELQAFLTTPAGANRSSISQTFQNYNLDVKTILLRSPSLYYDFNGYYFQFDPSGQQRWNISNGLFFNQQLSQVFSTSDNVTVQFGSEGNQTQTALLYYSSLNATPFKTLSSNLVFNGNNQWVTNGSNLSNSIVLYNTAQLYKGIDAILNLGTQFISNTLEGVASTTRRDLYVNVGTGFTPNPNLSLTLWYLGRLSHITGQLNGLTGDVTENRLNINFAYTPVPTLFLTAGVNVASVTGTKTQLQQNYGLNWTPFPDGSLQFSFFYADNYYPDHSRVIQPVLRWYPGLKRRSYLEFSYQYSDAVSGPQEVTTQIFTTTLKIFF